MVVGGHRSDWFRLLEQFELPALPLPYAKLAQNFLDEASKSGIGFWAWRGNWTRGGADGGKHHHHRHQDDEKEGLGERRL